MKYTNFPIKSTIEDYDTCIIKSVSFLKKNYPECSIFKVGGENIKLGISDIDLLIVSKEKFSANKLYLRNYPLKYIKNGILMHEFFSVDEVTFKNLHRITSYNLHPLVYGKNYKGLEIDAPSKIDQLYKMVYYLVANYPMNFCSFEIEGSINIKRSLTKLKKLFNFEELIKTVFNRDIQFIPSNFRKELNYILGNYSDLDDDLIARSTEKLMRQAQTVCFDLFQIFESESKQYFEISNNNNLEINGNNLVFSDEWKSKLYDEEYYYLPKNAAVIITVLNELDEKFLKSIKYSQIDTDFDGFIEIGKVLNNYLEFCAISQVNQLIVDLDFTLPGYNSFKYKAYQFGRSILRRE